MSTQAVLFDQPGPRAKTRHLIYGIFGGAIIAAALGYVIYKLWHKGQITPDKWASLFQASAWQQYLLPGFAATLSAALISILLAFILGLLFAMARLSDITAIRWLAAVIVEFFRSVPVLILMLFTFFFLTYTLHMQGRIVGLIGVVAGLVIYNSSVIAEVLRNGMVSLPAGQREAGLSIGLSPLRVRSLILMPQALAAMMPVLVSQLVIVLKDTALGYIILYPELLNSIRQMGSANNNMTVAFIVGGAIFVLINWVVTDLAHWLERRLKTSSSAPIHDPEEVTDGHI